MFIMYLFMSVYLDIYICVYCICGKAAEGQTPVLWPSFSGH